MRLWSLHPTYLDAKGLVALWREGLLAKAVLAGQTKGYRAHPQLRRFLAHPDPMGAIDAYLHGVLREAQRRGYRFDAAKLGEMRDAAPVPVTDGQLAFELEHLRAKLRARDPAAFKRLSDLVKPEPNPLFTVVSGPVATWEKI